MEIDEFLDYLRGTKREWVIRAKLVSRTSGCGLPASRRIRSGPHCPITAVAEVLGFGRISAVDVDSAGQTIGLAPGLMQSIVDASDGRIGDSWDAELRAELLEACGLPAEGKKWTP